MKSARVFLTAIDQVVKEKNIKKEIVIDALKEALIKGYRKIVDNEPAAKNMERIKVRVDINEKKGTIKIFNQRTVVKEVQDDALEISPEDAFELSGKKYQVNDIFEEEVKEDFSRAAAQIVAQVFKQKLREAEKQIIYNTFINYLGKNINAIPEKKDEKFILLSVSNSIAMSGIPKYDDIETQAILFHKDCIPKEELELKKPIKVYVKDVNIRSQGAQITVSRADEGFIKNLLIDNVDEIANGIVQIKSIVRAAGEKTKVAVLSNDPNIDPTGACIGFKGMRIDSILNDISTSGSRTLEKIEVIKYSDNPILYIAEALKPAEVIGMYLNENEKSAIAIVGDDRLMVAIGKKGVNVKLASKLTGWKIDVKSLSVAMAESIKYVLVPEVIRQESKAILNQQKTDKTVEEVEETLTSPTPISEEIATDEAVNEPIETPIETPIVEPTKKPSIVKKIVKQEPVVKLKEIEDNIAKEREQKRIQEQIERETRIKKQKNYTDYNESNNSSINSEYKMEVYTLEQLKAIEEEENEKSEYEIDEIALLEEYEDYYDED